MKSVTLGVLCSAAAIAIAAPAMAASSDYFLVIDGVEGESSVAIEVLSWSWGASNSAAAPNIGSSGQDGVSRESPTKASTGQTSVRESPSKASTGGTARAADLAALAKLDEVSGFTLNLAPSSPSSRSACATGKHIKQAHLVARYIVYDLEDVVVTSCTGGGGGGGLAMKVTGKVREFSGHVTLMK